MALPPLRWFGAADVIAAMPPLEERLRLAETHDDRPCARRARASCRPRSRSHPRPVDSFVHAMPAHLRADSVDRDLVGMKWVAGFATNNALGLASISAVVVLNDAETGVPVAMLDGGPITAERTAAVSGVAIRHFGPPVGGPQAGRTLRSSAPACRAGRTCRCSAGCCPAATSTCSTRAPSAPRPSPMLHVAPAGIADAVIHESAREAVGAADVVLTAASFGPKEERQSMTNDWLRPDATVVPIDYATYCAAEVARDAALFLVDQREQFLANREAGNFDGYPDPTATIGEAILARTQRPAGRVVVSHLGVGLTDLVFADAIVRAAIREGRGTTLPR